MPVDPLLPSPPCPEPSLPVEAGAMLLLLASATGVILLCLRGWTVADRRALRCHAARLARSAWANRDAQLVLGAAFVSLLGIAFASRPADAAAKAPPLGDLLLSASVMPVFVLLLCLARSASTGTRIPSLLQLRSQTWRRDALLGVFGGLAMLFPALILAWGSGRLLLQFGIRPELQDAMRWFRDPATSATVRLALAALAMVVAPVLEEILYRGVLLSVVLRNRSPGIAVALVSTLFAALHLQAQAFAPLLVVGVAFAFAMLRTGSLVTPIVMHMTFNAANLWLATAAGPP